MSNFEQKPGQGSAFENRTASAGAPTYRGFLQLPDGSVIGLAIWAKTAKSGNHFLSISLDDREGEFQAKKLNLTQTRLDGGAGGQREGRGGSRQEPARRQERSELPPRDEFDFEDDIPF